MRCLACDVELSNREIVRKSAITGMYFDLCDGCFSTIADQVQATDKDVPNEVGFDKESKENDEG